MLLRMKPSEGDSMKRLWELWIKILLDLQTGLREELENMWKMKSNGLCGNRNTAG